MCVCVYLIKKKKVTQCIVTEMIDFFSSSILAILAFILRLPREVRCNIWSFVVDVHVFDMADEYSFVDPLGEVVRSTISDLAYRPDR